VSAFASLVVVRTLLVPALVFLTGDRFWWPSRPVTAGDSDAATAAPELSAVR
jgi:RND superfamily putative drug exporter